MDDIGIAVVGLGRMGYVHAYNAARMTREARLVAVCDRQESIARKAAGELGCAFYTDINRMLEHNSVDAVCVATPTAHHTESVTVVALAGKPLFCEKPLAASLADTLHLVKVIKDAGIKCQIGFTKRFDPAYVEAEKIIEEGFIGKPVYIGGYSRDPVPPPPWACDPSQGGGLFIDMLLHDFDIARFLMKDEVATVYADETNLVVDGRGIHRFADNVVVNLHFRRGALAAFHASIHAEYGYDVRTEVFGSKGSIMIGGLSSAEVTLCTLEKGISKPKTFRAEGNTPHFLVRFKEAYMREMAGFAECIINDTAPISNEDDALEAFRVAVAAAESAGKKMPVALKGTASYGD